MPSPSRPPKPLSSLTKTASRRQFLKAAGALFAAPYFVPATALGHGGRPAPSERLTMGFIGVGNMGGGHLPNFLANKGVQVVAICDIYRAKRDAAQKKTEEHYAAERASGTFKGCETYNEFENLLARPDIDIVLIAVPDHWHALIATAACQAGKDVYCEKPLTLTIREAEALVKTVRRTGRVFQTGSQQRSDYYFRYACELVRNKRNGDLKTVAVNIGLPSNERYLPEQPIPDGLDWERWLGPAPWQPYNETRYSGDYGGGWRFIRDYSGGMTTDWGAHHFDIGTWGMGEDGRGPIQILPPRLSDFKTMEFRYATGVRMLRTDKWEGQKVNGVRFVGTKGIIEVNRGYFKTWPESIGKEPIGPNDIHLYESNNHQQNWLDCVRSRRLPICDVAIGASSITTCHLGNIATWTGRKIKWDPQKREIVGDEVAARWLDRPKRAPWRLFA
jgi:predicted dehydrogenase